MKKRTTRLKARNVYLGLSALVVLAGVVAAGAYFGKPQVIAADTPEGDTKSVIVKFKGVDPVLNVNTAERQQGVIEKTDSAIANATPYSEGYKLKTRSYDNLPYAVYTVDQKGEAALKADPNVEHVFENEFLKNSFDLPMPTIGASPNSEFSDGSVSYSGDGYAVAVIDTGVDKNHPALAGKVIAEACFGENGTYSDAVVESLCPGASAFSSAAGSGQDCTIRGCGHGTSVAGAAAMAAGSLDIDADSEMERHSGVAIDAKIVAIQVNSKITSATLCAGAPGNVCSLPLTSSYLAALDYVATLSTSVPIAAANLSIGSKTDFASTTSQCSAFPTAQAYSAAASALRARNIAPVVANGNSGDPAEHPNFVNKIGSPACATGAIAVGATNVLGTQLSSYSNNAVSTTLLAPGGDSDGQNLDSMLWLPENGTNNLDYTQGTSFAAPIVAGAFAVLREKHPNASVDTLTTLLQNSGVNVVDNRAGYTVGAKKRINLAQALVQSPYPTISTFTGPAGVVNEGAAITLNATVANATNCSINNGIGNVAISGGTITANVPGAATYVLTCANAYGDIVTRNASFTINSAPTVPAVTTKEHNKEARTFTLGWNESTDSDNIQEYRVYLNGQLVATLDANARSYTFENLLDNVTYFAEVRAVDTLGAISTASTVSFGEAPVPAAPNTGALALFTNFDARALLVAVLGFAAALAVSIVVVKHYRKQRS